VPKDKDYGKRWAVERLFSRLKEVFSLAKNRFIGIGKVMVHGACICMPNCIHNKIQVEKMWEWYN